MRVRKMLKNVKYLVALLIRGFVIRGFDYPRTANYVFSDLFPRFGNFKSQKVIKRSKTVVPHYPLLRNSRDILGT
jgi:hypothetical protein